MFAELPMDCDFLVIGGGSAGYAAARTAVGLGLKTVVVEGGREVGGLCILRGCMPSKALIESANRILAIRRAGDFGVRVGEPTADLPAIIERKRELIGEFASYRRCQLEDGRFEFVRGFARFASPSEVHVHLAEGGETRIRAKTILVATGSSISVPGVPGLAESGFLTSDDILDAETLPRSVVVLGAGPVALEMAHYMEAVGVRVTVVQRSRQFLSGTDPELAAVVEAGFRERGMDVYTGTRLLSVGHRNGQCVVEFEQDGVRREVVSEAVLNSLGRAPALEGLGLEVAGLKTEKGVLATDTAQRTGVPHIFAAGDCCGRFEIVHVAIQQGEIAARNAARFLSGEWPPEKIDYRLKLYVVFTEPQVAVVGMSEAEAGENGRRISVACHPFGDHGKSMVMGEAHGFVKLIVDSGTREILGAGVVGPHAADLIHEIVVAMGFRATAGQLAALPHYHPTLSEIWTYPAEELA